MREIILPSRPLMTVGIFGKFQYVGDWGVHKGPLKWQRSEINQAIVKAFEDNMSKKSVEQQLKALELTQDK